MRFTDGWRPLVAVLGLALLAGCDQPVVGAKVLPPVPPPSPTGYRLVLTDATVDVDRHVVVTFTLTQDDLGIPLANVTAVAKPAFTLAGLLTDPVSNLATWQSYLLTGSGLLTSLPPGGPGTPPTLILANQKQPGSEAVALGTIADLGGGKFTYTFAATLPTGYDPSRTVRVGAYLSGVTGTASTASTFDFVPNHGPLVTRDTVLTANCNGCHGDLSAHGGLRRGVKLCLTCHTTQNADPDTTDPAAMGRGLYVVPSDRTVYAGMPTVSFAATLLQASGAAAVSWAMDPPSGVGSIVAAGATVKYTPPVSVSGPTTVVLTASAPGPTAGLAYPVTVTVLPLPPVDPPTIALSPSALTMPASSLATLVAATTLGLAPPIAWTLSPASGAGTLVAVAPGTTTSNALAVSYTPPALVTTPTTVSVIATGGGTSTVATITVTPGPAGAATRFSDPNPLDLGRMVHRIHRGRNLPTLYLASSLAPPPALPSATVPPLPFLLGRNPVAPGTKFSIVGPSSTEFIPGRIVTRTDNNQPAKVLAEGINFPRDLRDCDVCHAGAPQESEVVNAISRRTCQSCHADVWYGAGPATDLVHFPHTGGPQADDTKCAGCHVSSPGNLTPRADIAQAHTALIKSPKWNGLVLTLVSVTGMTAGGHPTVTFTVGDGIGGGDLLDKLNAPTPAASSASGLPRALTRVRITLSGPAADYQTGNSPLSELPPLTLTGDAGHQFSYTFAGALPATAAGTWAIGLEARRAAAPTWYDTGRDLFGWPFTGETVTEYADNPVHYVDSGVGTWSAGVPEPAPRRVIIERARCQRCHLDLNLHGGTRHNPEYCVLCHAPDTTDWPNGTGRPKDASGNVNLNATFDAIEERSVHFEVMVHRIHTGVGHGTAAITVNAPFMVSGAFFDDVRFPNRLANCDVCHLSGTAAVEAIPLDARPTLANESATILHQGTFAHQAGEPTILPITASCISCHGTPFGYAHAALYTVAGVEQCAQCHVKGALSVATAHGLSSTATP